MVLPIQLLKPVGLMNPSAHTQIHDEPLRMHDSVEEGQ